MAYNRVTKALFVANLKQTVDSVEKSLDVAQKI